MDSSSFLREGDASADPSSMALAGVKGGGKEACWVWHGEVDLTFSSREEEVSNDSTPPVSAGVKGGGTEAGAE